MHQERIEVTSTSKTTSVPSATHTSAIIRLIEWSQANTSLESAVEQITVAFKAECGIVSRFKPSNSNSRTAAQYCRTGQVKGNGALHTFAFEALGPEISKIRAGAVVRFTHFETARTEQCPRLARWMSSNQFCTAAFVCLSKGNGTIEFLELYFANGSDLVQLDMLDQIAPDMARIVENRRPGLLTEALARQAVSIKQVKDTDAPILSPDNPAGLTGAELRVCVLVARGLAPKAVSAELGVSDTTVRTHLRKIYSKTGLDNYHMLARRLVSLAERTALYHEPSRASA